MTIDGRILVATEGAADAEMIRKLLRREFEQIAVSTDPARAVEDFERCQPAVLVLAFTSLEKAERYYLGLYRLSTQIHALPHQTLILCHKDDLWCVYELCKKQHFDDYVLFWPITHDAPRLLMVVHRALRQAGAAGDNTPTVGEFAVVARRLAELESQLELYAAKGGQCVDVASRCLQQAQQDIGAALDGFSRRLSEGNSPDKLAVGERAGLQQAIDHIKQNQIEQYFQPVTAAVQPVHQWAGALKETFAPQLESARVLQTLTERVRPLVLVVDDDEFQHKILARLLVEANVKVMFATSGIEALASLRRQRPDLVLMDINLPDISGVEATRRLKSAAPFRDIPVVMITGESKKSVVLDSLQAGASDFVVKPFNKTLLLAKVGKFLNGGGAP